MAKIDTTKIEGYENMSSDEKLAALESFEIPEADYTGWVKKDVFDTTASELAKVKRERNGAEKEKGDLETRLIELERKDKISTTKDQYISSGFSPELALATAEAFVDGNMETVLQNVKKFAENLATEVEDKALKGTPVPPASGNSQSVTVDYLKQSEEAAAQGDFTKAAHFQRLYAEQKK
jgi:hypothetical protein